MLKTTYRKLIEHCSGHATATCANCRQVYDTCELVGEDLDTFNCPDCGADLEVELEKHMEVCEHFKNESSYAAKLGAKGGAKGGKAKTEAKKAASAANGAQGGRAPRNTSIFQGIIQFKKDGKEYRYEESTGNYYILKGNSFEHEGGLLPGLKTVRQVLNQID